MRVEALEERIALSTIVVNQVADTLFQSPAATVAVLQNPGAKISLLDAINIANNSPGPDTIVLQPPRKPFPQPNPSRIYKLDKINNYWYGPNGLPEISSVITIQGNGATIERSGGPDFRFFYVSDSHYGGLPTGSLTLNDLVLQGGYAHGGNSSGGGGGLGAGGAIFNQGNLVLDGVLVRDNTAHGGNTYSTLASRGESNAAVGGAGIGQDAPNGHGAGGFGGPLTGYGSFQDGGSTREGQGSTPGRAQGFGGGGARISYQVSPTTSASGGFGGGGGGLLSPSYRNSGGNAGGFGGGNGADSDSGGLFDNGYLAEYARGGGGAGLGGAIFNRGGSVTVIKSRLTNNAAHGGDGAVNVPYIQNPSGAGSAFGGAIFNLNGSVTLIGDTIDNNRLDGGSGSGGRTNGYQVYNLAYGGASYSAGNTVVAQLYLGGTKLRGAPRDRYDLVNQKFLIDGYSSEAIVADAPNISASSVISTAPGNLNSNFVAGSSGSPGRGVVSFTYEQPLTMGGLEAVAADVERTVTNLARTHNLSRASTQLAHLASEIPDGLQQLAPVWQHDLASINPQALGSGRAFESQLLADLKHDVAAGVAAGEFSLTGPGAAAYLSSADLAQASLASVTIFNSTGFAITVSASLNGSGRFLQPRTIANGASSLFDFGSNADNFISINVSRDRSSLPPQATLNLNRPISGYGGKQFTVSVIAGRFSVSI
jgi:hypothetical protein